MHIILLLLLGNDLVDGNAGVEVRAVGLLDPDLGEKMGAAFEDRDLVFRPRLRTGDGSGWMRAADLITAEQVEPILKNPYPRLATAPVAIPDSRARGRRAAPPCRAGRGSAAAGAAAPWRGTAAT
mgnify:CR=1 FL=1